VTCAEILDYQNRYEAMKRKQLQLQQQQQSSVRAAGALLVG